MEKNFWNTYLKFFLIGLAVFIIGVILLTFISFGIAFSGGGNAGYILGALWSWAFIIPGMYVVGKTILTNFK